MIETPARSTIAKSLVTWGWNDAANIVNIIAMNIEPISQRMLS
jgi:hypothetical protein